VDGERDVQLEGVEHLLIPGAHGVAADEGGRVLGHEDRLAAVQGEDGLEVVRVERGLVALDQVGDGHGAAPWAGGGAAGAANSGPSADGVAERDVAGCLPEMEGASWT
jgi:hypothetical protein